MRCPTVLMSYGEFVLFVVQLPLIVVPLDVCLGARVISKPTLSVWYIRDPSNGPGGSQGAQCLIVSHLGTIACLLTSY